MKKCLLLLILLSAQQLMAQEKFGPKKKIGLVFSVDACYRTLHSDSMQSIVNIRNSSEIQRVGFTTGFSYIHTFGRFAIETGAQYSSKGYQLGYRDAFTTQPDLEIPDKINLIYKYSYLDVPLKLIYNFNISKVNFFISTGASANVFINQKNVSLAKYENGDVERNSRNSNFKYEPVNFAAMASFGAEIPMLKDKVRLRIEPIYRHSVTSIIDAPVKGYLYSTGLNAGIFVGI